MAAKPTELVVISYYDRRKTESLHHLLACMDRLPAGLPYDVCVVVNRDTHGRLNLGLSRPHLTIVERKNRGMNIGAWDHGWRTFPSYDGYLFLQDECYPIRSGWLSAFQSKANEPGVGLVGEYFNEKWRVPWDQLRLLWAGSEMTGHVIRHEVANRVDVYLTFLTRKGLPTGANAGHMRSLVWYAKRNVLEEIGGFPIGRNYGECIAAEIGVSKQVEALGLEAVQVGTQPFSFLRHSDWVQDPSTGTYVHI
jgi:hypothetical protein